MPYRYIAAILAIISVHAWASDIQERTLDNGLRVLVIPIRQAPVVHTRVCYRVGSRDERPDRQGFAHLFEHMMFRGSAHVAAEEHMRRIAMVGGSCNAYTSFDETVYFNTLPSNQLDMALWLEADRMASLKVTQKVFDTERKVVAEEYQMRMNQPYGTQMEELLKLAFTVHPYRWTPIGDMDQLAAASLANVRDFFARYYQPSNATLVIAGDVEPADAFRKVERWFGWIGSRPVAAAQIPSEPASRPAAMREVSMPAPLPAVMLAWPAPKAGSPDKLALELAADVLSGGRSGRLDRALVNGSDPTCASVSASAFILQDAGLFMVSARALPGRDPVAIADAIRKVVASLVADGPSKEEMAKAALQARVDTVNAREMADGMASWVAKEVMFGQGVAAVDSYLDRVTAVTPAEVKAAAARYLSSAPHVLVVRPSRSAQLGRQPQTAPASRPNTSPVAADPEVRTFPADWPVEPPMATDTITAKLNKGKVVASPGGTFLYFADHRAPRVQWAMTFRTGSHGDAAGKEGTAALALQMLRRGSAGMDYTSLTEALESRGISLELSDGGDVVRVRGSCLVEHATAAIELTRKVLQEPTWNEGEFRRLKQQAASALAVTIEKPDSVADRLLASEIWPASPLGRRETLASLAAITLDDVKRFHATQLAAANVDVVICGDVSEATAVGLCSELLKGRPKETATVAVTYPKPAVPERRRIIIVDRPNGRQATIRIGCPSYGIGEPDKFAGALADRVLSGGIFSRLGQVRAQQGLAYSVWGGFSPSRNGGRFTMAVDTSLASAGRAVTAMFGVVEGMRIAPVTDSELADAKRRVAGSMVMQMQTTMQQANLRIEGILNGYPVDYYDAYPAVVAGIGADRVQEVMRKWADPRRMIVVAVGPASVLRPQFEELGDVTVVQFAATQPTTDAAPTTTSR